jgi:ADP-dependent NAD(P)H-hydrate dehydratase
VEQVKIVPRLAARKRDAHKGNFGKVLIIGGSWGMSGAAAMAGKSALRSGAGLVRLAVPKSILPIVASLEPCYTTIGLAEDTAGRISEKAVNTVLDAVGENDAVAFGPGVGIARGVSETLGHLLGIEGLKLVIDADGLNNLAKMKNWPEKCKARVIVTPHPGEMRRLWSGLFREPEPQDRVEIATTFAAKTGACTVLKGAGTVVCEGERYYINDTGNPGMASGGTGDVLTGIITGLYGQGLSRFDAAVLGVYVHGLAGDIAETKRTEVSLIATDLVDNLGEAFRQVIAS